jgi:23S rRNA (guanosine2251-2'-O)-methyltransferase
MSPTRGRPRRVPAGPERRDGVRRRTPAEPTGLGGEQVEGRQAVRELLRARRREVREVWVSEGVDNAGPVTDIIDLARRQGVPLRSVPRVRLDNLARTEAPQGVLALAEPISDVELARLVERRPGQPAPFLVVLDGVTDPHNLGAVMRSAVSAGATGVVLARHRAAHFTPAAVKAAAGAVEYLPAALVAGIPAALKELADAGVWTVGLDGSGAGELWDMAVATEPVALVLGAEGKGLSRLVRQRCEVVVRIPMLGPIESLNVSAAGALACFEVARRRAAANLD